MLAHTTVGVRQMSTADRTRLSRELVMEIRKASRKAAHLEIMGRRTAAARVRLERNRLHLLLVVLEKGGASC